MFAVNYDRHDQPHISITYTNLASVRLPKVFTIQPWYLEFSVEHSIYLANEHGLAKHFNTMSEHNHAMVMAQRHRNSSGFDSASGRWIELGFGLITILTGWFLCVVIFFAEVLFESGKRAIACVFGHSH